MRQPLAARHRLALRLGVVLGVLALAACVNAPPQSAHARQDAIRFVGQSGIARANGIFHDWQVVEVQIDRDRPERSRLELEIDVASLDTGFPRRDEHLRDPDFFDVERWPRARVRVSEVRATGLAPQRYRARFEVWIRDRHDVLDGSFAVVDERPLVVEGEVAIDRTRFGVGEPDAWWNPLSPRNRVPVHFRVTLE